MSKHEALITLIKKYARKIETVGGSFCSVEEVTKRQLQNAEKFFANGVNQDDIIGFYDTTITCSGKSGYLFTDEKVYYLETMEKPKKLWYDDIKSACITDARKKDCDSSIEFNLLDSSTIIWNSCFLNKTPLLQFFEELLDVVNSNSLPLHSPDIAFQIGQLPNDEIPCGGTALGTYGTVNKLFEEERFHAHQGHGYAAERANDLHDRILGHDAHIVGDDNAKDGADRILDGMEIQSKYCSDGVRCINACFEDQGQGAFRYFTADGKPMQIEVPSDKYEVAIKTMEEKISNGQVKGVTDPKDASKIVKRGNFTYAQARNIAKAGTVESILYDAASGAVIATTAFGLSTMLTFAVSLWNGDEPDIALKSAAYSGLKVGGSVFITNILAGQLAKAGLNSAMVEGSEALVHILGPKASAVLINAFRNGSNIYGAAAMRSAAKLLRSNVITSGLTIVVLSSVDVVDVFRKRISGAQLFKNFVSTTSAVVGGGVGWLGGAAIGSAIFPGVGTIVGGISGAIVAGNATQKLTKNVTDKFTESDAEQMSKVLEEEFLVLASEYLLSKKEAEKALDRLQCKLDAKEIKNMFSSSDRKQYARKMLVPLIEDEVSKRKHIPELSTTQVEQGLRLVLEDAASVV